MVQHTAAGEIINLWLKNRLPQKRRRQRLDILIGTEIAIAFASLLLQKITDFLIPRYRHHNEIPAPFPHRLWFAARIAVEILPLRRSIQIRLDLIRRIPMVELLPLATTAPDEHRLFLRIQLDIIEQRKNLLNPLIFLPMRQPHRLQRLRLFLMREIADDQHIKALPTRWQRSNRHSLKPRSLCKASGIFTRISKAKCSLHLCVLQHIVKILRHTIRAIECYLHQTLPLIRTIHQYAFHIVSQYGPRFINATPMPRALPCLCSHSKYSALFTLCVQLPLKTIR